MHEEHLDELVVNKLGIKGLPEPDLSALRAFVDKLRNPSQTVDIALVGKYVALQDAYKSIEEAFVHAGVANGCKVQVHRVLSDELTAENVASKLQGMAGVFVAPGFGERGLEGKIHAIRYVRENGIPFLGVCLGMQMCVVEFARNILGHPDAASTEANPGTSYPIIDLMEDQKSTTVS